MTHERAALFHLVVARGWTLWVDLRGSAVHTRVPVARPLPHVADCVVQPVLVRRIRIDRCRQLVSIFGRVFSAGGGQEAGETWRRVGQSMVIATAVVAVQKRDVNQGDASK